MKNKFNIGDKVFAFKYEFAEMGYSFLLTSIKAICADEDGIYYTLSREEADRLCGYGKYRETDLSLPTKEGAKEILDRVIEKANESYRLSLKELEDE